MSWRESSPTDKELTREEIEQMHNATEEKIRDVEAKIQLGQSELSLLEIRLPRLEEQIRKGDQFTNEHLSEHVHCPYGGHTVDRINDLERRAGDVRSQIFFKGKEISICNLNCTSLRKKSLACLICFSFCE